MMLTRLRTTIQPLTILVALACWAYCGQSEARAASATLDLTPVGYIGSSSKNSYYVIFLARPTSSSGSALGHAFVGVGIEDYDLNRSSYTAYGVWPQHPATSVLRLEKIPARVLQETLSRKRDSSGHSPFDFADSLIVKATEEQYEGVRDRITRETRIETAPPMSYSLLLNDCVTFASSVAQQLGLQPPQRNILTPGTWLPEDFVIAFRQQVMQVQHIQYPGPGFDWTGPVLNGLPHGEGSYTGPGFSFHGHMKFGKYDRGRINLGNGRSFEGTWTSYQEYDRGVYVSPEVTFDGSFTVGHPTRGLWKYPDGSSYDGTTDDKGNKIDGVYTWPDGSYASGHFSRGKLAFGTYKSAEGAVYKGLFSPGGALASGTYQPPGGVSYRVNDVQSNSGQPSSPSAPRPYPGPPPQPTHSDTHLTWIGSMHGH